MGQTKGDVTSPRRQDFIGFLDLFLYLIVEVLTAFQLKNTAMSVKLIVAVHSTI